MPMRTFCRAGDAANAGADADGKDVERQRERDDEDLEQCCAHWHALRGTLVKVPA